MRGVKNDRIAAENRRLLVQLVERMQRTHGQLGVIGIDQQGKLDLRRRNCTNVDPFFCQSLEGLGGDAGVAAHADADNRDLRDVVCAACAWLSIMVEKPWKSFTR